MMLKIELGSGQTDHASATEFKLPNSQAHESHGSMNEYHFV